MKLIIKFSMLIIISGIVASEEEKILVPETEDDFEDNEIPLQSFESNEVKPIPTFEPNTAPVHQPVTKLPAINPQQNQVAAGFAQSCNPLYASTMCNETSGLHCVDEQCQCKQTEVYNSELGRCVRNPMEVVRNKVPGYGEICSNIQSCEDGLACTNGKCNCPQARHQIFDPKAGRCLSITLGICATDSDCVPGAFCHHETPYKEDFMCHCKSEFRETEKGICVDPVWLPHGAQCDYSPGSAKCDEGMGLQCRNGICSCPDDVFDMLDGTGCVGLVGSRCKSDEHCIDTAICKLDSGRPSGSCECDAGFTSSSDRKCLQRRRGYIGDTDVNNRKRTELYDLHPKYPFPISESLTA